MCKPRYSFEKVATGYEFYDAGVFQLRFQRGSFRPVFEVYASENNFSSNWIGSILRLFCHKYPMPSPVAKRNDAERFLTRHGAEAAAEFLRCRGFKVEVKLDVSVKELIQGLESRGYVIEGLLNDCYYNSELKSLQVNP
jgi:hypothetical protein